jgi:magnesium transporter
MSKPYWAINGKVVQCPILCYKPMKETLKMGAEQAERNGQADRSESLAVKKLQENSGQLFHYFSDFLGRWVLTTSGKPAGRLNDFKVKLNELFPKVTALVIRRGRKYWELDWSNVENLSGRLIRLRTRSESAFRPLSVGQEEILLREDLLDKQVVDTFGAKIERVNDVHLLAVHNELHLVHVDYGARGLLRRLGWLRIMDALTDWLFAYHAQERLLSWKYIQPLASDPQRRELKTNVTMRKLHELHPSDLADIIEELDQESRRRIFHSLDLETAAETLQEMDPKLQLTMLETASAEKASDILEEMDPDEATDLLSDLPEDKQQKLIRTMERPSREKIEELLRFKEGTAGSLMTKDYIAVREEQTLGQVLDEFRKTELPLDSVAYLYVTDAEGRLRGVLTLRHLLLCDRDAPAGQLMNTHLVKVNPDSDVEEVMDLFKKYKFMALPVVDDQDRLTGLITLKDIIGQE